MTGISPDTDVAVCPICQHPLENQQHILWYCTHPQMTACRNHYLAKIELDMSNSTCDNTTKHIIDNIHNILTNKNNWELLVGRVHTHIRDHLNTIPISAKHHFITHTTVFFHMTITIFVNSSLMK